MLYERQLVKVSHAYRDGNREWKPKGIVVMSSGSPITREKFREFLVNNNQTGSVHALVDETGVTEITPPNYSAVGREFLKIDDSLKIVVCEPAGTTINEIKGLAARTCKNLAICIFHLCRHLNVDPTKTMIRFVGKANENGIWMPPERKASKRGKAKETFSPMFAGSQLAPPEYAHYCENLVNSEVKDLQVQTAEAYAKMHGSAAERPVDAIGVGDVVLFMGGDLYTSKGASFVHTLAAGLNYGVIRAIYPSSKHCYEVAFPEGVFCVNKSTVKKSTLGHVD